MMKKFVSVVLTAAVAAALAVVGAAAPASAHTTGLSGVATCDTTTGTWTVQWSLSVGNVPAGVESTTGVTPTSPAGSTLSGASGVNSGGVFYVSTQTADAAAHPGVQTRVGNWGPVLFTQSGIPGSAPQAVVSVANSFSDGTHTSATKSTYFGGTCSITAPAPATAAVTVSAPTCTSAAVLHLGSTSFATWGTPTYSGSTYTVVATATGDHTFAAGSGVSADGSTKTFTGTLAPKLTEGCSGGPTPDAAASVTVTAPTCTAPGKLVYGTFTNATATSGSTPNGTTGPTNYSVTAVADSGHVFSDSLSTHIFAGTIEGQLPSQSTNPNGPCYNAPPPTIITPQPPTFVDECGTDNDTFTLPSTVGEHYSFTVSDTTTNGVRTVLVTAVPDAGYAFPADFTDSPWTQVYTNEECPAPPAAIVVAPDASACDTTNTNTDLTSWVSIQNAEHVTWAIYPVGHPEQSQPLTAEFTAEEQGSYTVVATAHDGYTLTDAGNTFFGDTHEFAVDVFDTLLCQLPTGAVYDAGASGDPATCTASTTEGNGYINLVHVPSQHSKGKVKYDIESVETGKVIHAGSQATRVSVQPGDYVVTASAVHPTEDGINGQTVFDVTVGGATTDCVDAPLTPSSLAFTGASDNAGLGLGLAAGMLVLGLAGLYVRHRLVKRAE